jgi:hypothetical protein
MLKSIFEVIGQLFTLLRDVRESREKITRLQEQIDDVQDSMVELSLKVQMFAAKEQSEREKFTLQLENTLLRMEKNLLPAPAPKRKRKR